MEEQIFYVKYIFILRGLSILLTIYLFAKTLRVVIPQSVSVFFFKYIIFLNI